MFWNDITSIAHRMSYDFLWKRAEEGGPRAEEGGPLDSFPNELFAMILGHLPARSAIGVTRVCRRWYYMANISSKANERTQALAFNDWDGDSSDRSLKILYSFEESYIDFERLTSERQDFPEEIFRYSRDQTASCCTGTRFITYFTDGSSKDQSISVIKVWTMDFESNTPLLENECVFTEEEDTYLTDKIRYVGGRVFLRQYEKWKESWNASWTWKEWDMQTAELKRVCKTTTQSDIFSMTREHDKFYIAEYGDGHIRKDQIAEKKNGSWKSTYTQNSLILASLPPHVAKGKAVQYGENLCYFSQNINGDTTLFAYHFKDSTFYSSEKCKNMKNFDRPPNLYKYGSILFWTTTSNNTTLLQRYNVKTLAFLPDIQLQEDDEIVGMFAGVLVLTNSTIDPDNFIFLRT